MESVRLYIEFVSRKSDHYKIARKKIVPHEQEIYNNIKEFKKKNTSLPIIVHTCLEEFIRDFDDLLTPELVSSADPIVNVSTRLILLASLQSELTYHLSDFSAVAKRLSERAFLHLRRSIVADQSIKQRWGDAFEKGEVACEKLGSSHLLLHGIWAFKVSATGGCTDLVFSENPIDLTEAESVSEALVLTEWKVVKKDSEWQRKAEEARLQASIYTGGVLGGLELRQYRYVVLVSKKSWPSKIQDFLEGDIVYRHINIEVDPDHQPSRVARRKKPETL
jgi:hypothetical protein